MAGVLEFAAGDRFILRIRKNHQLNPSRYWHNTYELVAVSGGELADLTEAVEKVVAFERAIHLPITYFAQYVIGTWEPDSVPYNPDNFYTGSINAYGTRAITIDEDHTVDLDMVLWVTRQLVSGRNGKLFYRGVLVEEDMYAPSGDEILDTDALLPAFFDAAKVASYIGDLFAFGSAPVHLCSITASGSSVRQVIDLQIRGVTINQNDHKFFNVGAPA